MRKMPGFYKTEGDTLRFWDGEKWTDQTTLPPRNPTRVRLIGAAIVVGVVLTAGAAWYFGGKGVHSPGDIVGPLQQAERSGSCADTFNLWHDAGVALFFQGDCDAWRIAVDPQADVTYTLISVRERRDEATVLVERFTENPGKSLPNGRVEIYMQREGGRWLIVGMSPQR